jgi:hypothetical protein
LDSLLKIIGEWYEVANNWRWNYQSRDWS